MNHVLQAEGFSKRLIGKSRELLQKRPYGTYTGAAELRTILPLGE
jgi:hypothetical protein